MNILWLTKVFTPLVRKAKAAKISYDLQDAFLSWMRSHPKLEVRDLLGEVRHAPYTFSVPWKDLIDATGVANEPEKAAPSFSRKPRKRGNARVSVANLRAVAGAAGKGCAGCDSEDCSECTSEVSN